MSERNKMCTATVGLVLVSDFGERLRTLTERMHVWIVGTDINLTAVCRLRAEGYEFTTFTPNPQLPGAHPSLDTIETHHGEYSCHPPYEALEVYGASLTDFGETDLRDFGFVRFEEQEWGFRASKKA